MTYESTKKPQAKPENPIISIAVNILVPVYIFDQMSQADKLGPFYAMLLGLAFPLAYGGWDFFKNHRRNWLSALGILRLVMVGSLAVAEADGFWFAVGEAGFPGLIALCIIASMRGKNSIVKSLLYNDNLLSIERIENHLLLHNKQREFQRVMLQVTWLMVTSFVLSAVLNFVLARLILESPAGTEAFNKEYARMTLLSWPVIVIPSMIFMGLALWRMFNGLRKLTGLTFDEIFKTQPPSHGKETG